MRVAVIGTGISGLGAAWALAPTHDVTVYESSHRVGGHSNTVDVAGPDGPIPVDTGFIVYNERTYPNLVRLFQHLDVPTIPSDMSFSFSMEDGIEYGGSIGGLLARPANLQTGRYRRMIADMVRFARRGPGYVADPPAGTLGELLESEGYSDGFVEDYLVPMAAAIWSARPARITDYPAETFLRFFHNHGLIRLTDRPRWRTVAGGSRQYVERLAGGLGDRIRLSSPVTSVRRSPDGVLVESPGGLDTYDHIVLAVHSDQALAILGDGATAAERGVLAGIRYQENTAVLHSDPTLMPVRRSVWSSWNYLAGGATEDGGPGREQASLTYWMNRLQALDGRVPLFVTLNPAHEPRPALVHGRFRYAHPQFDVGALAAQTRLPSIQGRDRVWFAGAWGGHGFHEDGLRSGLAVASALGSPAPWQQDARLAVASSVSSAMAPAAR